MSSVTTSPEAVRRLLALRRKSAAAGTSPAVSEGFVREGAQTPIVHAWSIGTTEAAQNPEESPARREECPPEVYIG